jgi:hypothetical protein
MRKAALVVDGCKSRFPNEKWDLKILIAYTRLICVSKKYLIK